MFCKILLIVFVAICLKNGQTEASSNDEQTINFPSYDYYYDSNDDGPTRGDLAGKRRKRDISGRIVGGEKADIRQFPYQVSLTYYNYFDEERRHMCGGSILSPNIVVTAAHCGFLYEAATTRTFQIRVGSSSSLDGGQLIDVEKIIYHKDYDPKTLANDISIMVLKESIKFSDVANKIPIATKNRIPGAQAIVSGWGYITEKASGASPTLNFVTVPVLKYDDCKNKYYSDEVFTPSMMCAGYPTGQKDACSTDSGGPLVQGGELIGVVSWGTGCARENRPGIYTNVFYMADWIKEQLKLYSV